MLCLVLAACGSDDKKDDGGSTSSTPSQQASAPDGLVKSGQLTVCMDISFPPMESYEDGSDTPVGFDVDLAKAVAENWGASAEFINTTFDGLLPAVQAGRCDVAWSGMYVTPERLAAFPAVPYYKSQTVLLVQPGNPSGIASTDDLSGKTVAVQSGTSLASALADINKKLTGAGKGAIKIQEYAKGTELVQQLIVGRADAAMTIDTEAAYRLTQNPGKFEVGYRFPETQTYGLYFNPDVPAVGAGIAKTLQALQADGSLDAVAKGQGLDPANLATGAPVTK